MARARRRDARRGDLPLSHASARADDGGFPPLGAPLDLAELARELSDRLRAAGVELSGLDQVRADAETKLAAASTQVARAHAYKTAVLMLIGMANRELRRRGDHRRGRR